MLAQAQELPPSDQPSDYAHALPLSISGKQGVVGFRLPQVVYLNAQSPNLADLRVFDALGAKQPFALYQPKPQSRELKQSWPVKRFPVLAEPGRTLAGIALDFKAGGDGALLSVKTRQAKGIGQSLAGLVLDLGKPRALVDALRFKLSANQQPYSAQVWLEVSEDLKHWETVGAAELSWLVNPQTAETLASDRLEFAPRRFRYARLSWREGAPIEFADIAAESVEQTADAPVLEKLVLQAAPGKEPGDWLYQASAALPVESLELRFTEPNVVMPAAVGTYREVPARKLGQPSEWVFQTLTRGVFYQITQEGQLRRSGAWPVPVSHYADWVVRPQTQSNSRPELVLTWQPATLVLLAGGQAPYTLAFGREDAKPAALDLSQVAPGFSVEELGKLELAQAGPLQTHAAATQTSAAAKAGASAQNRLLILWAALLAGVGVLGVMVWRLVKQMKQS